MIHMHFTKLKVWQKAITLITNIYKITDGFPARERYGLSSQMRRAAVSVASNIAEGSQRTTQKDFANFLLIARGSLVEVQTQLIVAYQLGIISVAQKEACYEAMEEISKMLFGLHKKVISVHS